MKISEYLILDHRAVARKVSDLEGLLALGATEATELQMVVGRLQLALEDHAKFEEHVLFPALEHCLGRNEGPLAVMEAEHSRISALFSQIEASRSGDNVGTLTRNLTNLLIRHFIKEERDLFPIADQVLAAVEIDKDGTNELLPSGLTRQ